MLAIPITIVLIAFASVVDGLSLEYITNGRICTAWIPVPNTPLNVDPTKCSSSLGYELTTSNNEVRVRFCCTYQQVVEPGIGPPPQGCGLQSVTPIRTRIVGGKVAKEHSWPWLVSLQYNGNHFCGGTLIDQYHVLTAAHCLQDRAMTGSSFTVVAGLHVRSQPVANEIQRKQVSRIYNHEGYNEYTNVNDIAIIRLATPITITSYVNFACLPVSDPALDTNVIIAGWGTESFDGHPSDPLRQATIQVMDPRICRQVYHFDTTQQICAGTKQYDKDSCQGDSGGPLMYETNGRWYVSGVVSYGDECAKFYRPGVYARVSHYLPWIQRSISALSGK